VRTMASPVESKPAQARFSLQEVALHNSPTDCWLIVRKKVYNVTPWIRRHPGGDLLLVKAGRDCTYLFDSYHPISARCSPYPRTLITCRCRSFSVIPPVPDLTADLQLSPISASFLPSPSWQYPLHASEASA
jgi:hypothetical protein